MVLMSMINIFNALDELDDAVRARQDSLSLYELLFLEGRLVELTTKIERAKHVAAKERMKGPSYELEARTDGSFVAEGLQMPYEDYKGF